MNNSDKGRYRLIIYTHGVSFIDCRLNKQNIVFEITRAFDASNFYFKSKLFSINLL